MAHNGIDDEGASQPTGLALQFSQLSVIDLGRNVLTTTKPFAHMTSLDELWISGNKIASFDDVQPLSNLTALEAVYLEYNPLADDFEYRKKLKEIIPSLNQIDANMITGVGSQQRGNAETLQQQMRRLQDKAVQKAEAQQKKTEGDE